MSEKNETPPETPPPGASEGQEEQINRAPDFRSHMGRVQASVWSREIDGHLYHSITLTRSYKDKYDRWQRTTNLDQDDLLPACEALREAYFYIQQKRHQSRDAGMGELQVPPRAANS